MSWRNSDTPDKNARIAAHAASHICADWGGTGIATCAAWLTSPCVSAGIALAELMSRVGPIAGPYHAIFASMAKANASRHRLHASKARPKARNARMWYGISAVYHADAASGRAPRAPTRKV